MTDFTHSPAPARDRFHTTRWTRVMAARGGSEEAREALAELCEHYYDPVLAYLQRSGEARHDEARDLAHEFFAHLLEGDRLDRLDRERGRFRSYLLGALKHFLSGRRARAATEKRGGRAKVSSLDETGFEAREGEALADGRTPSPDSWFDRQWAVTVLDRSLSALEKECAEEGREESFRRLSPWLTGEAEHGDQAVLAEKLGVPAGTLKSLIYRMRRRFRARVRAEIAGTVGDGVDPGEEMSALFAALGGGDRRVEGKKGDSLQPMSRKPPGNG